LKDRLPFNLLPSTFNLGIGMRDRQRERLKLVAVAGNVLIAELLKDQLRQAGIPSMVRNRAGGAGVIGGIDGTFEVSVLEGDFDRAAAVIGGGEPPLALTPPALPATKRRARRRRWW
jgi:hypothetical protein